MRRFALLLSLTIAAAQKTTAQQGSFGSWNIVNIKYNHTAKLSVFGEAQLRSLKFYNDFHYYEFKGGVNYKVHKSVALTLAMGSYQTYKEGGSFKLPKNNNEFRLWPQVILFHEIGRLKIEQRYRAELRWTSNGYRNRFRYRAGIAYPFGKSTGSGRPFQAAFSNELFFTDNEPYFERNRAQLTLNYKATKHSTIQLGYLYQFDYKINDETGRTFLVIGFYHELSRKTAPKTAQGDELKDN